MIQDYHVKENDENLITCRIEMQGEHRAIKYTGKHFLALQKAIGFYTPWRCPQGVGGTANNVVQEVGAVSSSRAGGSPFISGK